MANTLLTVDMITKETLVVLHQTANFLNSVNKDYDNTYGENGITPKVGDPLRIRLPNEYKVRKGVTMGTGAALDTNEQFTTMPIKDRYGVDMSFTTNDLSLEIEEFSERYIKPAVSVLVSNIEADFYQDMYKAVYNIVDDDGNAPSYKTILNARKNLVDNLAPNDSSWTAYISTAHEVEIVDNLKALFNAAPAISSQFTTGAMGTAGGLVFRSSTHASDFQTGAAAKNTGYSVNGGSQTGSSITIDGGSNSLLAGDIVTFDGVFRVHPETKRDTGVLQQFVVTADQTGAGSLSISPELVSSATDARQNVTASPADNAVVVKVGAGASETLSGSLAYHKDAFAFGTCGLVVPDGVDFAGREVMDGVSVRLVRDYTINDDSFPCRLDVQPSWSAIRPKLATRIHADG